MTTTRIIDLSKLRRFQYAGVDFYMDTVRTGEKIDLEASRIYEVDGATISNNFASGREIVGTRREAILKDIDIDLRTRILSAIQGGSVTKIKGGTK